MKACRPPVCDPCLIQWTWPPSCVRLSFVLDTGVLYIVGDSSGLLYPSDLSFIVETNQKKKKKKVTQPQITLNWVPGRNPDPGADLRLGPCVRSGPLPGGSGQRLCWRFADESSGGLAGELISLCFVPRVKLIVVIIFFVSGVPAYASRWRDSQLLCPQQSGAEALSRVS